MTKDEYIQVMKQPEIPMETWFEYYRECGGYITDLREFTGKFSEILHMQPAFGQIGGTMKQITLETAVRRFILHYTEKFNL